MQKQNLKIIFIFFFLFIFLSCFNFAKAEILFEENFNILSDWESSQTESKICGTGVDTVLFNNTCTTNCPPPTLWGGGGLFTGSYYSSSVFCDNPGNQMYRINDVDPRGGTGRSLQYWAEIADVPNWTGGRIVQKIDQPQNTIYFSFFAKFPSDFIWSDGTDHGYHKMLSVSSYPPNDTLTGIFGRGGDYWNAPDFIWQNYTNIAFTTDYSEYGINPEPRGAPGYSTDPKVTNVGIIDYMNTDNLWHHYEVGLSLNSAPGLADGVYEIYVDGELINRTASVVWVDAKAWESGISYNHLRSTSSVVPTSFNKGFRPIATHVSGGSEPMWQNALNFGDVVSDGNGNQWEYFTDYKWNVIWFLDNIYIGADGPAEQDMYLDDIVVANSYIDKDYVIGGGDEIPPSAPTGLGVL